jgi:hypothetical protein
LVAGQDEAQARATLFAMQARLRDPYDALGVSGSATPADIRSAFLALTKVYHPARFGRMTPEIQRLANEVFLGLRAAHDALSRPTLKPGRGSLNMPVLQPTTPPASTSPSAQRATTQAPALARPPTPPPVLPRTATAPLPPRTATAPLPPVLPRTAPAPSTPPRPKFPATSPATSPGTVPPRAPAGTPAPGPDGNSGMRTIQSSTTPPPRQDGNDKDLAPVLELLGNGHWEAARTLLSALTTRSPQVARYRALLAYSRGREAQLLQRIDEARVELEQALQIDPELQLAKTALGELFTRRK